MITIRIITAKVIIPIGEPANEYIYPILGTLKIYSPIIFDLSKGSSAKLLLSPW